MWSSHDNGTDMLDTNANARPQQMAEEEANSVFSHDEGSSGDDTTNNGSAGAPRKRKREKHQKTSCELCKARKVKCDRAEPACSWCARHNRTCVYLERQKPGSRIGFSLELEAKVNRLDALLQALGRRVEEHISNDHVAAATTTATATAQTLSPAISNQAPSQPEAGFRQDGSGISPGPGLTRPPPPPSQTSNGRTPAFSSSFWQAGDAQDALQNAGDRTSVQALLNLSAGDSFGQPGASPGVTGPRKDAPSTVSTVSEFPPHDMLYTLVDLYFKHCNTWCPILDRKTTFGAFFGSTSLNEADRVLLHAIVATTLRFLKDQRLSSEMRSHYHAVSKHRVQMYAMENVSIAALRALVILCLDELGTSNGPRGWNMLALLAQNVRQLELCEESSVYLTAEAEETPHTGSIRRVAMGRPESWIEDEGRRRLCWMVYLLDRYATIATTTFDFMLDDSKMKRGLPCSYDLFSRNVPVETRSWIQAPDQQPDAPAINKPENLGSFSYHCEILRILSKVHDFLKTPINVTSSAEMAVWRNTYRSLDGALDNWLQSLPSEYSRISALCHSDPASRVANWFMLHSAYVTSVVRLHSSAAYPTVRSHIFVPSHYAMQRCLSAVQSLGDIAQDVFEANGLDLLGPPFAFSLWVAARLLLIHAATVGCPVDPKIDFFIETLRHVGQYWEVANNYAKILARVVQRGRQGDMSFTAMRKSAHDLVTLTSSTRRSGLEPTSTQVTSLSELDNIDVFDFFNYPKMSEPTRMANGQTNLLQAQAMSGLGGDSMRSTGVPDPESDWLGFNTPFN
ncbi:C6 transcription factor [Colletotrichum higginsianum IMI 349063]|uniref:C6 transcription factor n=3 Tax=Colletotrichum higginsianum TaxID=80884 RepID=A0A1B7Y3N9_COLHI|nr:C6 transcription factor [Colletotrichum higginsianum IMI 349063]OBR06618.1 C6 transcription factor [Colletotrichum higginsianum IMI 349063]